MRLINCDSPESRAQMSFPIQIPFFDLQLRMISPDHVYLSLSKNFDSTRRNRAERPARRRVLPPANVIAHFESHDSPWSWATEPLPALTFS